MYWCSFFFYFYFYFCIQIYNETAKKYNKPLLLIIVASKLFHVFYETPEVAAQMRQEIEVRILRDVLVDPKYALYSEISDVMLKFFSAPLLLPHQKLRRNKAVFAGEIEQKAQVCIEFQRDGADIGCVDDGCISKDISLLHSLYDIISKYMRLYLVIEFFSLR